ARARLPLAEVLQPLGFVPRGRAGAQVRGPCPVHGSRSAASRSFAAHLGRGVWHCFRCGAGGHALDLWAAVTRQPPHGAVGELCGRVGRDGPWLPRPRPRHRRPARAPRTRRRRCTTRDRARPTAPGSWLPNGGTPGTSATDGAANNGTLGTVIPRCTGAPPLPTSLLGWAPGAARRLRT